ncbi:sensor histidine kinase [Sphaerimonospora cavernae]|uniref:histidine kinase n=1 Tax=Sphaerimonospora cavernae TaxID=1740611 RepID=A0ABV6U5C9_9ACTN
MDDATVAGPIGAERPPTVRWLLPGLARVISLIDVVLLLSAGTLWITGRVPLRELVDAYLLGDAAIGVSFAVCGAIVATRVPGNRLGWLMLGGGTLYLIAAAVGSMAYARIAGGDGGAVSRVLAIVFSTVWMPAIAIGLPLVVQTFPTGRPLGRVGRWFAVVTMFVGVTATLGWVTSPDLLAGIELDDPGPLLPARVADDLAVMLGPMLAVAGVVVLASSAVPLVRLVRHRGEQRLQMLWLVWAGAVVILVNTPGFVGSAPPAPVPLLTFPLIPAAMTIAILRYRLYGIRVLINRTLVYTLLTGVLLGLYVALSIGIGQLAQPGPLPQVIATGAVAVAFSPVRSGLQATVDRLFFGDRTRPYAALVRLGRQLETPMAPGAVLPAIASVVATSLRLPYVRVAAGREGGPYRVVEHGSPGGSLVELPLSHRGEPVGTLTVALPPRQLTLDDGRAALLEDLRRQAGPAVHAVVLTEDLMRSRERTVAALEEERRRIRRDLHDGIGPVLTGSALKADAARGLLGDDQTGARQLLDEVVRDSRSAIDEIRRLVYGLRPPAIDDLGLVGALRQHAETLAVTTRTATTLTTATRTTATRTTATRITVTAPAPVPSLPAAVEVAAYRIATEAITNVLRHADAGHAEILVYADGLLHIEVNDDGRSGTGPWRRGVGLTSMRERAEELGGGCEAGPTPDGGRVHAALPLELP